MKLIKHFSLTVISLLNISVLLTYCTYDNELEKYGDSRMPCDTSTVTYSNTIQSILEDNCYTCHNEEDASSIGGNVVLDSYQAVEEKANRVLKAVQHAEGYSNMPKGQAQLDECTIAKIRIWVEDGAPNN
jgi:uncharacterized membrane protein